MKRDRDDKKPCPRCEVHDSPEHVCELSGIGFYDARAAERLVRRKRRAPTKLDGKLLARLAPSDEGVYMPHVLHVNPRKFGVVGKYIDPSYKTPAARERAFLLDGNHRAKYAHLMGRPFYVYELTLDESASLFLGKRPPRGKRFSTGRPARKRGKR